MTDNKIKLKIIAADKIVFDDEVDEIRAMGTNGSFGVLPGHIAFMTTLNIDVVEAIQGCTTSKIAVIGGLFQIVDNTATILTEAAEMGSQIDVLRAKNAKERAEARLGSPDADIDVARSNLALAKALARLKAALKD